MMSSYIMIRIKYIVLIDTVSLVVLLSEKSDNVIMKLIDTYYKQIIKLKAINFRGIRWDNGNGCTPLSTDNSLWLQLPGLPYWFSEIYWQFA